MPSFVKDLLRRVRKHPSFRVGTGPVLSMREGEVAVVTYTPAADKMKVFSAFIREGLESGDMVNYIYPDEESKTVKAKLEEHGIDIEIHERNGTLRLRGLAEYYLPDRNFDKEGAIKKGLEERAEAKKKGYKHWRELEDVGDFSFLNGQWKKYLEYWDDPRWGSPGAGVGVLYEPFIIELTAVNIGGMSEEETNEILKTIGGGKCPQTKFIDLLQHTGAFSKSIDMSHEKLVGCRFLLEFDPTLNYERIVEDFAKEAVANVEPVFVFTSSTSSVRTCLASQRAVRFFLMSVSTSTPESISENEILLPANNAALILESLSNVLETHAEENVFLIFDSLSELLGSMDLEKTYSFLHYVLDILSSAKATALFLLNTNAHEPQVVSCLKELFRNQLVYRGNQLKVVKGFLNERVS